MSDLIGTSSGGEPARDQSADASPAFDRSLLSFLDAPLEFAGWRPEQLSWKTACFIHGGAGRGPLYRITGPDVARMFSDMSVNDVSRLAVGSSTHLVLCSPAGHVVGHGMLLREDEHGYVSIVHPMHIERAAETGAYDVEVRPLSPQRFFFQVAGPSSLPVLEAAFGEDLHDIRFLRHRPLVASRFRHEVRILRIGMAGTLAYEVHADVEDAPAIYDAILRAGEPSGIQRLGSLVYLTSCHTENGFPNEYVHFLPAVPEYPELVAHLEHADRTHPWPALRGSMGPDVAQRFVTPYDLGWGHLVKFNHDFVGRAALEAIAAAPPRRMVTLEWNVDDVVDTFRSQFTDAEPFQAMTFPGDQVIRDELGGRTFTAFNDEVRHDGARVGMSMGRMYSAYYRRMISLAALPVELAAIGTEVRVLWGDPGTRQREIRATVARYPYLDLERNENIDTASIPRPALLPEPEVVT